MAGLQDGISRRDMSKFSYLSFTARHLSNMLFICENSDCEQPNDCCSFAISSTYWLYFFWSVILCCSLSASSFLRSLTWASSALILFICLASLAL